MYMAEAHATSVVSEQRREAKRMRSQGRDERKRHSFCENVEINTLRRQEPRLLGSKIAIEEEISQRLTTGGNGSI